jgi:hypothetical protein
MFNRVIEIHHSELDRIVIEDGTAVLHFPSVYIHQSTGTPAVDAGTGWVQRAILKIGDARIEGALSEELRESSGYDAHQLSGGSIRLDENFSDNLIPIPLDAAADVELSLESWGSTVTVKGRSILLQLIGEPEYVEEFEP